MSFVEVDTVIVGYWCQDGIHSFKEGIWIAKKGKKVDVNYSSQKKGDPAIVQVEACDVKKKPPVPNFLSGT